MNRTHCKNGHELKEGTLRLDNNGKTRTCRMCERRRDREGYVRAKAKGAHPNTLNGLKTHCPQGHEYTPENTSQGSKDRKHRKCKTCNRNRERERRSRLKAEKVAREG
ncbi:gp25 [Corynebacterium phage P1201]|uniref:Gp25 n=1 Tax=Corynebacterium phage P1201 TaxID=384848 RepID=A7IY96_9CAUD|nr:gp25 [Corynebacterium phage P1201]ABF57479.1 gp25 [Corynebacterium phage P1201]